MKVAIIGKGRVGTALGPTIVRAGHEVVFGVRNPDDGKHGGGDVRTVGTAEAVAWAEIVIAAIMWEGVDELLASAGDMTGKILIDCINPLDFGGGLRRLIDGDTSTASLIQAKTSAIVVKTLNQVGSPVMADPSGYAARPLQFIAADDAAAKAKVQELLSDIGFDVRDAGGLDHAVDLEGMARLWIAQTFVHGMNPQTSWALLTAA
jgi:8-hydroxy-5-deazaflavin:NADPH oxidoreductase